ncbi:hypothetical protein [Variovorax beijingensis]|uniref:hypothetical protein n=1 Tax=Variovorax beijingensis TaxID=2496117 RepID=UPI003F6A3D80
MSGESPALPPPDAPWLAGANPADAPGAWPLEDLARMFTLPWSAYVRLLSV